MSDLKRRVRAQFEQAAAHYSTSPPHAQGEDLAVLVEAADLHGDEQVLDVGCGAGHAAVAFAPHVARVVALDLSPAMLSQVVALARERGVDNVTTQQGDVEQLPFPDSSFDRVVSRYSAHHWPHPRQALAEIARVLKPGGRFLLSDTVGFQEPALDTFLCTVELLRDISHVRDHTVDQWLAMFQEVGLVGQVVHRWDVWLEFDPWVQRIGTPGPAVAALRWLLRHGPQESRRALQVQEDLRFALPGAVLRGHRLAWSGSPSR